MICELDAQITATTLQLQALLEQRKTERHRLQTNLPYNDQCEHIIILRRLWNDGSNIPSRGIVKTCVYCEKELESAGYKMKYCINVSAQEGVKHYTRNLTVMNALRNNDYSIIELVATASLKAIAPQTVEDEEIPF